MRVFRPYMRVANGLWSLDKGDGMTELNLLDALVARFREIFKSYELIAKSGLSQTVKVFPQFLPQPSAVAIKPKADSENIEPQGYNPTDIESNFPCVIVKLADVIDKEEGTLDQARINVNILVGIYDENKDNQGYRDVWNIIEAIRQDLLTMPARVLAERYRLEMPMKSYVFDDEPTWPIYYGVIETVWETGRPLMPNNFQSYGMRC